MCLWYLLCSSVVSYTAACSQASGHCQWHRTHRTAWPTFSRGFIQLRPCVTTYLYSNAFCWYFACQHLPQSCICIEWRTHFLVVGFCGLHHYCHHTWMFQCYTFGKLEVKAQSLNLLLGLDWRVVCSEHSLWDPVSTLVATWGETQCSEQKAC